MPIHTAELALHGRNYITASRVDREAESRSSGVTHRNQHQQCLEPHFELNTFAASYLNTQGLYNSCLKSRQRRP